MRAVCGFISLWMLFVVANMAAPTPVSIVTAFLFAITGCCCLLGYYLRGAEALVAATLAAMFLLSGMNHYKFRFPAPLAAWYEDDGKGKPRLLDLDRLRVKDDDAVDEYDDRILPYAGLLADFKVIVDRIEELEPALDLALMETDSGNDPDDDPGVVTQAELICSELTELYHDLEKNEKDRRRQRPVAARCLNELEGRLRVIEPPYPSHIIDDLRSCLTEEGMAEEDAKGGWNNYGGEGGRPVPPERLNGGKKSLILVAVCGGGLRSAVWSHIVLGRLEGIFEGKGLDFPAHVRIISGASGGMLGAAYYVASLPEPGEGKEGRRRKIGKERILELEAQTDKLRSDFITPLMQQFVFGDIPNLVSPWTAVHDRGKALEAAWSHRLEKALDITFPHLQKGEEEGWRPSLVFAPMMVEDGRRLLISNLTLNQPLSNDAPLAGDDHVLRQSLRRHGFNRQEAIDLLRKHTGRRNDIRKRLLALDGLRELRRYPKTIKERKKFVKGLLDPGTRRNFWLSASLADLWATGAQATAAAPWMVGLHSCRLGRADEVEDIPVDPAALSEDRNPFPKGNLSVEGLELFRLFDIKEEFKLATAVRMSASFPYFAPAVPLPTKPRRRVVDAGYYDNYGISVCASWLHHERNKEWLQNNVDKVCIVQIRDGVQEPHRRLRRVPKEGSTGFSRGWEELMSPLESLNNARVGSNSFRNDGLLEVLDQTLKTLDPTIQFRVVNFEYPYEASLNWFLSETEYRSMKMAAGTKIAGGATADADPELRTHQARFNAHIDAMMDFLYPQG